MGCGLSVNGSKKNARRSPSHEEDADEKHEQDIKDVDNGMGSLQSRKKVTGGKLSQESKDGGRYKDIN